MLTPEDQVTVDAVTDALQGKHRQWMQEFAQRHKMTYDEVMAAGKNYIDNGEVLDTWEEWEGIEFWDHYEVLARTKVKEDDKFGSFFVCCARS